MSNTLFDMLAAGPPETIAIVTSKFPSIHFMSPGARSGQKRASRRFCSEWDLATAISARLRPASRDAKPDLVWIGDIGLEGNMLRWIR